MEGTSAEVEGGGEAGHSSLGIEDKISYYRTLLQDPSTPASVSVANILLSFRARRRFDSYLLLQLTTKTLC